MLRAFDSLSAFFVNVTTRCTIESRIFHSIASTETRKYRASQECISRLFYYDHEHRKNTWKLLQLQRCWTYLDHGVLVPCCFKPPHCCDHGRKHGRASNVNMLGLDSWREKTRSHWTLTLKDLLVLPAKKLDIGSSLTSF